MEQRDPHGTADSERETDGAKEHARDADSLIHAEIARLAVNDPWPIRCSLVGVRGSQFAVRWTEAGIPASRFSNVMCRMRSASSETQKTIGLSQ